LLEAHLSDVCNEADRIATELRLTESHKRALVAAAVQHDVGKALFQWQGKLPHPTPDDKGKWAKSSFLTTVRL
jgi:hypothetical protein